MRSFLIILLVFVTIVVFGQIPFDDYLNEIKNKEVKEKLLSFKAKTDEFLLRNYKAQQKKFFQFDFRTSTILGGEDRPSYSSLFNWEDPSEYSIVIHSYNLVDNKINLLENVLQ